MLFYILIVINLYGKDKIRKNLDNSDNLDKYYYVR